jgi:SAM-dependent methyltransferase
MEGGYGAKVYDVVYRWKDYDKETVWLKEILASHGHPAGTLLDVACGTGQHLSRLRDTYEVVGLELDPEMAALARARNLKVLEGDMEDFDLARRFDIVTCLFSSIGYMETPERLRKAIANMAAHLKPSGLLVVEPWFSPDQWREGYVHADYVDDEDLKIARMSVSRTDGPVSVLDLHHMVATSDGVETFVTHHRMGLFADWEYRDAFTAADLTVEHDEQGLMGRGLYLGKLS